jgi:hypothetical protein
MRLGLETCSRSGVPDAGGRRCLWAQLGGGDICESLKLSGRGTDDNLIADN